jgi:hypothetical protein
VLAHDNHKNTTLTLRVDPMSKEGLRLLAEKEHRNLTNMIQFMIREQCKVHNTTSPISKPLLIAKAN